MQHQNQFIKRIQGFSLIELMVSLSVFAIVMVVSTGTLITLINANAKAQALNSAMTNLSFALDSMTREIRMGYKYNCRTSTGAIEETLPSETSTSNCTGGSLIAFKRERDDVHMGYRLREGVLEQKVESGNWVPLTAKDVVIDTFLLNVQYTESYNATGDENQPMANILLKGHVNNGLDTDTDFNIQTHIVQRRLDIL
jgi:prepilin-type N-terminal cleavage/methylation domain-containing protein